MFDSPMSPVYAIENLVKRPEDKYFDRKSAGVKPNNLAALLSAFANADGGDAVVGVRDDGAVEGIRRLTDDQINALISSPSEFCMPTPRHTVKRYAVVNADGDPDEILIFHVEPHTDQIIRLTNGETYLRVADKTKELKGDDLRNLEYAKEGRLYEDEHGTDASIEDLDADLLAQYMEKIGASRLGSSPERVLRARGFIKDKAGIPRLTNAAVLLFAKNIAQFYPNSRIRFIRYEGTSAQTGTSMNIVKDVSIELPILRIIGEAKRFISSQLRDFVSLDRETGQFRTITEYPEFAWQEGIVNAVAHREYAMQGDYIRVTMFDDRLEIRSPGGLPNLVTVENIRETRYSRNPRIARLLTEFGWVRELNEGVKRIYQDMSSFFLDEPEYRNVNQCVTLTLKNNIIMRRIRQSGWASDRVGIENWKALDDTEKEILLLLASHCEVSTRELNIWCRKSPRTITRKVAKLLEDGLIRRIGGKFDSSHTYSLV